MKHFVVLLTVAGLAAAQSAPRRAVSPQAQARVEREIRHEIFMVPQYGVFDHVTFQVNGDTVVLQGDVTQPVVRNNIERAVKTIEGVEKVENKINVLPLNTADNQIRIAVYRSIYGFPALERYALQAIPSIHIVVRNGSVTLEGAVANKNDADIALTRARTVPGTFAVTSNLKLDSQLEPVK